MAVTIHIPTPLRPFTDGKDVVDVANGQSVKAVFEALVTQYSGLKAHLYDADGNLRRFVNVYLNDEDIRYIDGENSPVSDGQTISIVPSIAGGIFNA